MTEITLIKDLRPGSFRSITGTVMEIEDVKEFKRKDGSGKGERRMILLKDRTGQVPLVLWNDECLMLFKKGQTVQVNYGKCSSFKDNLQISIGFDGYLQVDDAK